MLWLQADEKIVSSSSPVRGDNGGDNRSRSSSSSSSSSDSGSSSSGTVNLTLFAYGHVDLLFVHIFFSWAFLGRLSDLTCTIGVLIIIDFNFSIPFFFYSLLMCNIF